MLQNRKQQQEGNGGGYHYIYINRHFESEKLSE